MAGVTQAKKEIPPPVLAAQDALRILAEEKSGVAAGLDKRLPAVALQMAKSGVEVTAGFLVECVHKNELDNFAAPKPEKKTYAEIVAGFSSISFPSTSSDNPIEVAGAGDIGALRRIVREGKYNAGAYLTNELPLREAAENGHLNVVKYLVEELGADARYYNDIPMREAAKGGHLDIVRYFVEERGANIHALEESALRRAVEYGHLDVVKYLAERGADVHIRGENALWSAVERGDLDTAKYLVEEQGADVHALPEGGLWHIALDGHYNIIKYLVEKGMDASTLHDEFKRRLADYIAECSVWQKVAHADLPDGSLSGEDPAYFKPKVFDAVRGMLRQEKYEGLNLMNFYATALFGTEDRVLRYLEKWGKAGKSPLHDIIYQIRLPKKRTPEMDLKSWGDAVLKCGPSMARLVKFADKVPVPEKSEDGRTWSMVKTREKVAQFAYKKAAENPALAVLCVEHAVEEADFNKALKLSKNPPAVKNIPDIAIDGEQFDMPGATFHRLAADDIRGLFLGELTDCCQSIGGEGEECAKHGFTSEDSGFYVVENAKGRVVGQTWAWRGTKDELVFDSLETLGENVKPDQWIKLTKAFSKALAKKPGTVTSLDVGLGGGTPAGILMASSFNDAASPAKPIGYKGYRDSHKQVVVWRR